MLAWIFIVLGVVLIWICIPPIMEMDFRTGGLRGIDQKVEQVTQAIADELSARKNGLRYDPTFDDDLSANMAGGPRKLPLSMPWHPNQWEPVAIQQRERLLRKMASIALILNGSIVIYLLISALSESRDTLIANAGNPGVTPLTLAAAVLASVSPLVWLARQHRLEGLREGFIRGYREGYDDGIERPR